MKNLSKKTFLKLKDQDFAKKIKKITEKIHNLKEKYKLNEILIINCLYFYNLILLKHKLDSCLLKTFRLYDEKKINENNDEDFARKLIFDSTEWKAIKIDEAYEYVLYFFDKTRVTKYIDFISNWYKTYNSNDSVKIIPQTIIIK